MCEKSPSQATFSAFAHNISCEGFIEKRNTEPEYEYSKNTPRKEALAIAVKMKKIGGVNVLPIESNSYQKIYTDIDYDSPSDWIPSVVETALANKMISAERSTFEPDRLITRSEAYAMIMSSVCIKPSEQ